MADYYLNSFQEEAISVFMDKFGIDAGVEVISSFEKTGSLGKAMIAYCHSLHAKEEKYIIKRDASAFPFLVLTENDKYVWGCREDAAQFTMGHSKRIQGILAFKTTVEKYNKSLESDQQSHAAHVK